MLVQLIAYALLGGFAAIIVFGHVRLALELLPADLGTGRRVREFRAQMTRSSAGLRATCVRHLAILRGGATTAAQ